MKTRTYQNTKTLITIDENYSTSTYKILTTINEKPEHINTPNSKNNWWKLQYTNTQNSNNLWKPKDIKTQNFNNNWWKL